MITVAELFPLWRTARKWLSLFRHIPQEEVRLEKEFRVQTVKEKAEMYTVDGKLHRDDGPAYILKKSGNIVYTSWNIYGVSHRVDGPAIENFDEHGNIIVEEWKYNGKFHRDNGPARIGYHKNTRIKWEEWWEHGHTHNPNGPRFIEYYDHGGIFYTA